MQTTNVYTCVCACVSLLNDTRRLQLTTINNKPMVWEQKPNLRHRRKTHQNHGQASGYIFHSAIHPEH